jgi:hypothetical protein
VLSYTTTGIDLANLALVLLLYDLFLRFVGFDPVVHFLPVGGEDFRTVTRVLYVEKNVLRIVEHKLVVVRQSSSLKFTPSHQRERGL